MWRVSTMLPRTALTSSRCFTNLLLPMPTLPFYNPGILEHLLNASWVWEVPHPWPLLQMEKLRHSSAGTCWWRELAAREQGCRPQHSWFSPHLRLPTGLMLLHPNLFPAPHCVGVCTCQFVFTPFTQALLQRVPNPYCPWHPWPQNLPPQLHPDAWLMPSWWGGKRVAFKWDCSLLTIIAKLSPRACPFMHSGEPTYFLRLRGRPHYHAKCSTGITFPQVLKMLIAIIIQLWFTHCWTDKKVLRHKLNLVMCMQGFFKITMSYFYLEYLIRILVRLS